MASTSQKHRLFVTEPMGDKDVTELAGIGSVYGDRLRARGYGKAFEVLGQYLIFKMDGELFKDWLYRTCGANAEHQRACHMCLAAWCIAFL